ncbi:hypothetical protein AB0399_39505, partial [Streptomyces sp. NPDC088194]|uniref:hypothetical protein n=1 Tax=Streptomyces sp. NPDC088194 TaxID=3154931 RepID=UPI00344F256C
MSLIGCSPSKGRGGRSRGRRLQQQYRGNTGSEAEAATPEEADALRRQLITDYEDTLLNPYVAA